MVLPPGEYKGPLVIKRSCALKGDGATLWNTDGPVLTLDAPGTFVYDLRVEIIAGRSASGGAAIVARAPDCRLQAVEVYGNVVGVDGESDAWELGRIIDIGEFAADTANTRRLTIAAASVCRLQSRSDALKLSPADLKPGLNEVLLRIEPMRDGTILFGDIFLNTGAVIRRMSIKGRASQNGRAYDDKLEDLSEPTSAAFAATAPTQPRQPSKPVENEGAARSVIKGERVAAEDDELVFRYTEAGRNGHLELDAYVFCLQADGKAHDDDDLIFFGAAKGAGVEILSGEKFPTVKIELSRVKPKINRLVLCYSIYEDGTRSNFSLIKNPAVHIYTDKRELYSFAMLGLNRERTVNAAEIYRYKGRWRISFVGAGYDDSLRRVCENYGFHVI